MAITVTLNMLEALIGGQDYVTKVVRNEGGAIEVYFDFDSEPKKEGAMSEQQTAQQTMIMRAVVDIPIDPSSGSPRTVKAVAEEMRGYAEVVLVKDRGLVLTDHMEVVSVHLHRSAEGEACNECVELATDEKQ